MSLKKITKSVIKKLEKFGIGIADIDHPTNKEDIIFTGNTLIHCNNNDNKVDVSFHVGTKAEDAGKYILILNKIRHIEISISDSFIYGDGKIIRGKDAYTFFEAIKGKNLIESFLKTQALINAPGYMGTVN